MLINFFLHVNYQLLIEKIGFKQLQIIINYNFKSFSNYI